MTSYVDGTIVQTGTNATPPVSATVPANVLVGQKMVAVVIQQSVASTTGVITPVTAGSWTPRPEASGHAGTTNPIDIATFTRTATTADAASTLAVPVVHQFTGTNVQGRMIAAIVGIDQVDDSSPVMTGSFSAVGNTLTRSTTAITTTGPARMIVATADRNASGYDPGTSGLIERLDLRDAIAPTAPSNASLAVFDSGGEVAAGTYTYTVNATTSTSTTAQVIIALRPAAAVNAAPTLTAAVNQSSVEPDTDLTSSVTGSDAEGDTITYTATVSPNTVILSGTGNSRTFKAPVTNDGVTVSVTWNATDSKGAAASAVVQTFEVLGTSAWRMGAAGERIPLLIDRVN